MITARQLIKQSLALLKDAGVDSSRQEVEELFLAASGLSRPDLVTKGNRQVSARIQQKMFRLLLERRVGRPLAYILGKKFFYGQMFIVNEQVLIPRPETEFLVEKVIERLGKDGDTHIRILEVGTGSGVIAISLKKAFPASTVLATDISASALRVARRNGLQLGVSVQFYKSNLFMRLTNQKFDVIVANLPYGPEDEMTNVSKSVTDFEPLLAINGGKDGLELIEKLLSQASNYLKPGGLIALEIWHTQGRAIGKLTKKYLPNSKVAIEKDLAGFDRYAFITSYQTRRASG